MSSLPEIEPSSLSPLASLPRLRFPPCRAAVPSVEVCRALWDKYEMPEHIRTHSERVAELAVILAEPALARAREAHSEAVPGGDLNVDEVRASALLHDLAKSYTIYYGGSHAQLGAAWALAETGHAGLAQGVLHHVCWPWPLQDELVCSLPILVLYADKRVMHTEFVTVRERFEDLVLRYGKTEQSRRGIDASRRQAMNIECALSARLGVPLDAYTPDSGRLVKRA